MTWHPIDTAPTDGTEIIGWDGQHRAICYWYQYKLPYWPSDWLQEWRGDWYLSTTGGMQEESCAWHPTHWQHLPDHPPLPEETP